MHRIVIALAAAGLTLALAAVPASAAPGPGPVCGHPRHASGHVSLWRFTRRERIPLSAEIAVMLRCSGRPYRFTGQQAAYFDGGNLRAPMPRGMLLWQDIPQHR